MQIHAAVLALFFFLVCASPCHVLQVQVPKRLLCETALLFTFIHMGWMRQTTAVIEGAPSRTGLFLHNFNSKHDDLPLQVYFFLRGVSFSPYLFLPLLPPFEHSSESRPLTFWSCIKEEMGEKHYRFCVLSDSNIKECRCGQQKLRIGVWTAFHVLWP